MMIFYKLMKILFSRIFICGIGILLQLAYLTILFWTLGTMFSYSYLVFLMIGACAAVYIMNREISPGYKLIWVFAVLSFPIFGCMLYFFFGRKKPRRTTPPTSVYDSCIEDDEDAAERLLRLDTGASKQARYIRRNGAFRLYRGTQARYFTCGEELMPELLNALENAQRYIFIEFFIIDKGIFLDRVMEILQKKAAQNVEVRVMYDDFGCLLTLPRDYRRQLEAMGIACRVFGRLKPYWSGRMNNRDHRKIVVVDGKVAFTGGINLADEYINTYAKHGYWKDSAVMLHGEAAKGFAAMFLQLWDTLGGGDSSLKPERYFEAQSAADGNGYCIPYADSPDDDELLGENIYLNMINGAQRYVYITTPYLILDSEVQEALILAAKNGIDVRIITPHIPDKRFVHAVTRANYPALLRHGVRIYEFLPGFIHAKNFVSDDFIASVGTVNLDYRSLYLHYECGVWLCNDDAIRDIRNDFMDTLQRCREISLSDTNEKNMFRRIGKAILRLFSPTM